MKHLIGKFFHRVWAIFFEEKSKYDTVKRRLDFEQQKELIGLGMQSMGTPAAAKQKANIAIPIRYRGTGPEPDRLDTQSLALLKNSHLGQRCFVLGNGPSLAVEDLELLRWEYTFASNKIYLCFGETQWRPTYYSVEDRLVLEQNKKEIMELDNTLKIMPEFAYKYLGDDPSILYFRFPHVGNTRHPLDCVDFPGFSFDADTCVYWGSTIVYTQIQLAAHMGFKEIFLMGVDHSYVTPKKMENGAYICEGECNHFHKDYRKPGERWNKPQLEVLTHSYAYAKKACDEKGIHIYNATRKTQLDVFEKVKLERVLNA